MKRIYHRDSKVAVWFALWQHSVFCFCFCRWCYHYHSIQGVEINWDQCTWDAYSVVMAELLSVKAKPLLRVAKMCEQDNEDEMSLRKKYIYCKNTSPCSSLFRMPVFSFSRFPQYSHFFRFIVRPFLSFPVCPVIPFSNMIDSPFSHCSDCFFRFTVVPFCR